MAAIGMSYAVAAPITSHTDGSAITYGTGYVVGHAVSANVSFNRNDSKDYGDNIAVDTDFGLNDYTIDFESNDIAPAIRAKLLGWTADATTATQYDLTDSNPPLSGFGYLQHLRTDGVDAYDTYWFYKVRFAENSIAASTKEENIEWQHVTINGTGMGAYIDSTGKAYHMAYMRFASETAAVAWLKSKANIT